MGPYLSESMMQRYAGQAAFERGVAYFYESRIAEVRWVEGAVKVQVRGDAARSYTVSLWQAVGGPGWSCDCPVGERGAFCKHAVAAGLAVLAEGPPEEPGGSSAIRRYLESLDHDALVALLMEQAGRDETLATRLESAAFSVSDPDVEKLRAFVVDALEPEDFVGWWEVGDFLERAESAADLLEKIAANRPAVAADLTATALGKAFAAVENVDDSGGQFGSLLDRLGRLFADLKREQAVTGEKLAETLFPLLRSDPFHILELAAFQDLLGEVGLDWLRDEAQRQLDALLEPQPPKKKGRSRPAPTVEDRDPKRRDLVELQKKVAQARGSVDDLVAAQSQDLDGPGAYMTIVQALEGAGRLNDAIPWAEAGIRQAQGPRGAHWLEKWLVQTHQRLGHAKQALDQAWQAFDEQPNLQNYQLLWNAARQQGVLEEQREKALARIHSTGPRRRPVQGVGPVLVAIHLWEGHPDYALAAAREWGCGHSQQRELAAALEAQDPGTAGDLYKDLVEAVIERRNNPAYDEATDLLKRVRELWGRAGRRQAFAALLADIRDRHGRKRNLMQRLNTAFAKV